jgi:hypothetical protein
MKSSTDVSTGRDAKRPQRDGEPSRSSKDESAPLPHETDQQPESQHEDNPRGVGRQAHEDIERGLEDTDRRGGDDYQTRTQNDAHARTAERKPEKKPQRK